MLSLLDNLSSLDCLYIYIYIRCKGHKRWKLANRMSDGTMLTRKFNPSIRRRFLRSHRCYSRKLYDFGQSRVTNLYPTFCNRIGNILPKTTESGATFLVTFSQFEESRENQDSKSVTRTGNDQSCCEFAFFRETDLSRDLYPRQCLLNLRIFTGGTL